MEYSTRGVKHRREYTPEIYEDPFQDEPNMDLKLRLERAEKCLKGQRYRLETLKADNYRLTNQNLNIEERIKEKKEEIKTVIQDLSASTVDAPAEGAMSPDMAGKDLYSLTQNIFLVAREILSTVKPLLPAAPITIDAREAISQNFFRIFKDEEASYLMERLPFPCSPLLLLIPVIHRSLFRAVMIAVFQPFGHRGLDQPTEQLLSNIYTYLGETETQDRRSRWRTLTYQHISRERPANVWIQPAAQYYQQLQAMLQPFLKGARLPGEKQIQSSISAIFEQAVTTRDKVMTECTEVDCSVVLPTHGRFASWMKPFSPVNKNPPQKCIFPLSWVVQFSLSRGQGQQPEWFNSIYAIVLADNSSLPTSIRDLDKLS